MNRIKISILAIAAMFALIAPAMAVTSGTSTSGSVAGAVVATTSDSWAQTLNTYTDANSLSEAFFGSTDASSSAEGAETTVLTDEGSTANTAGNSAGIAGDTTSSGSAVSTGDVSTNAESGTGGVYVVTGGSSQTQNVVQPHTSASNAFALYALGIANSNAGAAATP